jgi:hypothetical protein
VAQNVFAKRLFVHFQPVVPALDVKTVISAGITELAKLVGSDKLQAFDRPTTIPLPRLSTLQWPLPS